MGPTGQDKTATDSHISKGPKRACDCCRKRKVKCDAHSPCGPCKKAAIRCAYLQPPLKKGPKSLRSARVLTELRKIDEAGPSTSDSSISPAELRDWTWSSASSPNAAVPKSTAPPYSQTPPISIAPQSAHSEPFYFGGPSVPGFFPLAQTQARGPPVRVAFESNRWQSAERPPIFHRRQTPPSQHSDDLPSHLPSEIFLPYVLLFFNHLFPIMPIIDRETYLNPSLYNASSSFTSETYAFLCALSAATIVQLDAAAELPPFVVPPGIAPAHSPAELFVSECLRERAHFDYIDQPSTSTVMTSFFIFCYYGNEERHSQAWYYLQESITFAQTLDLDDENAIIKLDPVEAQWHRRLYWLLFVTERCVLFIISRLRHCDADYTTEHTQSSAENRPVCSPRSSCPSSLNQKTQSYSTALSTSSTSLVPWTKTLSVSGKAHAKAVSATSSGLPAHSAPSTVLPLHSKTSRKHNTSILVSHGSGCMFWRGKWASALG